MHGLLYLHRVLACYNLTAVVNSLVNDGISSTNFKAVHSNSALVTRNNLRIKHITAAVNLDILLVSRSKELVSVSGRHERDTCTSTATPPAVIR